MNIQEIPVQNANGHYLRYSSQDGATTKAEVSKALTQFKRQVKQQYGSNYKVSTSLKVRATKNDDAPHHNKQNNERWNWISEPSRPITAKNRLPDIYSGHIIKYTFYAVPTGAPAGNFSKKYDCLFQCIKHLPRSFESNEQLKRYLKLRYVEPVPISCFEKLEKRFPDYKFIVSGDHTYNSTKTAPYTIRLKLIDNHYTLDVGNYHNRLPIRFFKIKPVVFYNANGQSYDGEDYKPIDPNTAEDGGFKASKIHIRISISKNLKAEYDSYMSKAKAIETASNGKLNLRHYKSIKDMALSLFFESSNNLYRDVDPISLDESNIIEKGTLGQTIYSEEYSGSASKFDITSMYPNLLITNRFPMKQGEWQTLKELPDILPYGLYRVKIRSKCKTFRKSVDKVYPHTDIEDARKHGWKVKLIQDESPNAFIYPEDSLTDGSVIFGKFVRDVYTLKNKGVDGGKQLLNILWGALCQVDSIKKVIDTNREYKISESYTEYEIKQISDDRISISLISKKRPMVNRFTYARIKPFLLGFGRSQIRSLVAPIIDSIKWINTDGFITTADPMEFYRKGITFNEGGENGCSKKVKGKLFYEGTDPNCTIANVNDYQFEGVKPDVPYWYQWKQQQIQDTE